MRSFGCRLVAQNVVVRHSELFRWPHLAVNAMQRPGVCPSVRPSVCPNAAVASPRRNYSGESFDREPAASVRVVPTVRGPIRSFRNVHIPLSGPDQGLRQSLLGPHGLGIPRTLSGRFGSGPCSGIWHGPDQTRPDPTRQSPRTCRRPKRSVRRVRVVEFRNNTTTQSLVGPV